jgi:hypothetical protein
MKTEYGIDVPRGVPKDWKASDIGSLKGGEVLRQHNTPAEWGDPDCAVSWFDRFRRCRLCIGHYPNGRSATVRSDVNGKRKTSFGDVK